ncbi:MAG TPA: DUF2007 domain-containing protein [Rhodanobacteraceae bacterium]
MRTVYHAETLIDAQLVKDRLEAEGIPAFIAGQYLTGGIGQLPARDIVSVGVPDGCFDDARPIIDEIVAMLAKARQELAAHEDDDPGLAPSMA